VKRILPKSDIKFKPNKELTEIVRSWPKYLKETKAFEEWGWKTKFLLKETVEDFIKEVQSHPEIYGGSEKI
jgi:nucleoside-diphosphate-sugar epimerase